MDEETLQLIFSLGGAVLLFIGIYAYEYGGKSRQNNRKDEEPWD